MGAVKRGSRLQGPTVLFLVLASIILALRYVNSEGLFKALTTRGGGSDEASRRILGFSTASLAVNGTCSCPSGITNSGVEACPPELTEKKVVIQEKIVEKEVKVNTFKQWWAEGRDWHTPGLFPLCSMDVCFNFSRCENKEELLAYTYDVPRPPERYFEGLNSTAWFTADPDEACLFFVFQDLESPWRPHPSVVPHWNHGMNHVLITFADLWLLRNPPPETIENASVLSSALLETTYRPGFDIGIPLPGRRHARQLQNLKPFERKYLVTFRGTRYLGRSGEGTFRSHDSLRIMHNGKDVVVVTSCSHAINDMIRNQTPALGAWCDEDQTLFDKYDFDDLMNSTFSLAPAGRSASSYRFIEVISAGCIPVLIADNHVRPFENIIQWPRCALQFPTREMHRVLPALRGMSAMEIERRQAYCLWIYEEFLKDDATLLRSVMRALKARFYGVFAGFSELSAIYESGEKVRRRLQFLKPN